MCKHLPVEGKPAEITCGIILETMIGSKVNLLWDKHLWDNRLWKNHQ